MIVDCSLRSTIMAGYNKAAEDNHRGTRRRTSVSRCRDKKKLEDEALVAAYNKMRAEQNLPPISLTLTHIVPFKGGSRPNYNPPPEILARMTESDQTEWRHVQRKKRKAEKMVENRRTKKDIIEKIRKELGALGMLKEVMKGITVPPQHKSKSKEIPNYQVLSQPFVKQRKEASEYTKEVSKTRLKSHRLDCQSKFSKSHSCCNPPSIQTVKMSKDEVETQVAKDGKIMDLEEKQKQTRQQTKATMSSAGVKRQIAEEWRIMDLKDNGIVQDVHHNTLSKMNLETNVQAGGVPAAATNVGISDQECKTTLSKIDTDVEISHEDSTLDSLCKAAENLATAAENLVKAERAWQHLAFDAQDLLFYSENLP